MNKVSTSVHFLLKPGCEDHSLLNQTFEELEHGLDSNFMDSVKMPELQPSVNVSGATASSASVSSGLLTQLLLFLLTLN